MWALQLLGAISDLRGTVFLTIAIVLLVLWAVGFFIFPVVGGLLHIILVLAIISAIWHSVKKRKTTRV